MVETSLMLFPSGFSARSILRFMHNHHLLQITGKPKWLTVQGGRCDHLFWLKFFSQFFSINYVNKVISRLPKGALRLSAPVHSVSTSIVDGKQKVTLRTVAGHVEEYDHVIMASHSGTTLRMLENGGQATLEEKAILGGFKWTHNPTVLHSDVLVSNQDSVYRPFQLKSHASHRHCP
jgi:predicted NAD/FAD-binding protein